MSAIEWLLDSIFEDIPDDAEQVRTWIDRESVVDARAELRRLREERDTLAKFVRFFIEDRCWNMGHNELDGGTIQDKAVEMGLLKEVALTEDNFNDFFPDEESNEYGLEIGDTIYEFTDLLATSEETKEGEGGI